MYSIAPIKLVMCSHGDILLYVSLKVAAHKPDELVLFCCMHSTIRLALFRGSPHVRMKNKQQKAGRCLGTRLQLDGY